MPSHDIYSPSRLAMLDRCAGFQSDGAAGAYAARGTEIGEQLARYVTHGEVPVFEDPAVAAGLEMLDTVIDAHPRLDWVAEPLVDTGLPGISGYCDLVGTDAIYGDDVLIEIKTGHADRPPAAECPQVSAYALGLLAGGSQTVCAYKIECDLRRKSAAFWDRSQADALSARVLRIAHAAALSSPDDWTPGRPHCGYCARAAECPRLSESAAVALTAPTLTPAEYVGALTPASLGEELARVAPAFALAETYTGALKARAIALLEAGAEVPGWSLRKRKGARRWVDESAARAALLEVYPKLSKSLVLPTPAQIEKTHGRIPADLTTQSVAKTLCPVSTK